MTGEPQINPYITLGQVVQAEYARLEHEGKFFAPVPLITQEILEKYFEKDSTLIHERTGSDGEVKTRVWNLKVKEELFDQLIQEVPELAAKREGLPAGIGTTFVLKEFLGTKREDIGSTSREISLGAHEFFYHHPRPGTPVAANLDQGFAIFMHGGITGTAFLNNVNERFANDSKKIGSIKRSFIHYAAREIKTTLEHKILPMDNKPDNFFVRHDISYNIISVQAGDFGATKLQYPNLPHLDPGLTDIIREEDLRFGTKRYMSPQVYKGNIDWTNPPVKDLVLYPFGELIGELLGVEIMFQKGDMQKTYFDKKEQARQQDWRTEAKNERLEGLIPLYIHLTDKDGCDDINKVLTWLEMEAQGKNLLKDPEIKRSWKNRKPPWYKKYKSELKVAGYALAGAALLGGILGTTDFYLYKTKSFEGRVHTIAQDGVTPQELNQIIDIAYNKFKNEDLPYFLKVFDAQTIQRFPIGTRQGSTAYVSGTAGSSQDILQYIANWWELKRDPELINPFIKWAEELKLDWRSTDNSDRRVSAIGRYAPLSIINQMLSEDLSTHQRQQLKDLYRKYLEATAIGIRHYSPITKTFGDISGIDQTQPYSADMLQESILLPLIMSAANSPDLATILDPSQLYKEKQNLQEYQLFLANAEPITLENFYRMIVDSGITTCNNFVTNDGKSFWSAILQNGKVLQRNSRYETDPNYGKDTESQVVLAQNHLSLELSLAQRTEFLDMLLNDSSIRTLQQTLGKRYNGFIQDMQQETRELHDCSSLATLYRKNHSQGYLLPEYLFVPEGAVIRNLQPEMLATMQNTLLLAKVNKNEGYRAFEYLLSNAPLSKETSFSVLFGMSHFPHLVRNARKGNEEFVGGIIQTDETFVEIPLTLNKK